LKPILIIIKSGRKLSKSDDIQKNAEALLSLTKKHGIDIVWKDLAMIVYASYRLKPTEELVELLEPLTAVGRPFRFSAMALLAMYYKNLGDYEKAYGNLSKIIESREAPSTFKKRMLMLQDHMKNILEKK
jgi:hypothetical protein